MSVKKADNGRYRARVYHRGRQVAMATFDRKADADQWERDQRTALTAGTWSNPKNGEVTLAEVIAEFLSEREGLVARHTFDTDEANLRLHVSAELKRRPIGTIQRPTLRKFVNELVRTKPRGTAKRIRESVAAVFAYAVEMDYLPHNPVRDVRLPKGDGTDVAQVRPFTDEEFDTMLAAQREYNTHYADIVEFLRETGLRWGEMKALRVRDFVREPFPFVLVSRSKSDGYAEKQPKGRRSRRVPLMGNAAEIVERLVLDRGLDDFIFRSTKGSELSGPNFTRDLRWSETAGGHRLHDLRHTAATSWLHAGINVKVISVWLGHSTTQQTVNRYSHWMNDDSDIQAIAKTLEERRSPRAL